MDHVLNILKSIDVDRVLIGVAVLVGCLLVTRLIMRLTSRLLKKTHHIDQSLHTMLKTTLRILLYFISIVFAANTMGVPVSSFLAVFSVVGLAVSLAVQGVLSNLAGGVIILASKPFALGDYIETEAVAGTVKDIGFLHTRMIAPDGKMIFVPNNLLYNSKLINYTSSGTRRIDLNISAAYDCSPEEVRRAAMAAIRSTPNVLHDPAPEVLLEAYGENAIQYTVRAWSLAQDYLTVRYTLSEAIYQAFRDNGVKMTYPHINVHMQ
ncbi:MAG: mechanosensitive ion channel family protein [Clostridia bacterium]|nr:mechanosensitive ion channel family protein [Clostridia bacterium]